jgi:hypothetical protein
MMSTDATFEIDSETPVEVDFYIDGQKQWTETAMSYGAGEGLTYGGTGNEYTAWVDISHFRGISNSRKIYPSVELAVRCKHRNDENESWQTSTTTEETDSAKLVEFVDEGVSEILAIGQSRTGGTGLPINYSENGETRTGTTGYFRVWEGDAPPYLQAQVPGGWGDQGLYVTADPSPPSPVGSQIPAVIQYGPGGSEELNGWTFAATHHAFFGSGSYGNGGLGSTGITATVYLESPEDSCGWNHSDGHTLSSMGWAMGSYFGCSYGHKSFQLQNQTTATGMDLNQSNLGADVSMWNTGRANLEIAHAGPQGAGGMIGTAAATYTSAGCGAISLLAYSHPVIAISAGAGAIIIQCIDTLSYQDPDENWKHETSVYRLWASRSFTTKETGYEGSFEPAWHEDEATTVPEGLKMTTNMTFRAGVIYWPRVVANASVSGTSTKDNTWFKAWIRYDNSSDSMFKPIDVEF